MELLESVLTNLLLLFGLVALFNLAESRISFSSNIAQVLNGLVIGLITIVLMMNAWPIFNGAFYDGRTVIISVTALYFSAPTALIATLIAIGYRILVGGTGMLVGILFLVFSLLIGRLWKSYIHEKTRLRRVVELYLFGLSVHVAVLVSMLFFPYPENIEALVKTGPIIVLLYPFAVLFLAMAINTNRSHKINEKKYRTLIDNNQLGIIHYNEHGVIEMANDAFAHILGLEDTRKLIGLDMLTLPDAHLVAKLKAALDGKITVKEGYYQSYFTGKRFPTRIQFSPIMDQDKVAGGIGTIMDLSHQYEQKERIQALKNKDPLTGLLNRSAFDERILHDHHEYQYPVALIAFDINSLQIINTSFGYKKGNEVIVAVSDLLQKKLTPHPEIELYRIGGDEFAIIAIGTSQEEAEEWATSIQKAVRETTNTQDNVALDFSLSVSYGISILKDEAYDFTSTLNQVIENLNTNKIYDGSGISTKTIDVIMTTLFTKSTREKKHSERVSKIATSIAQAYQSETAFTNRVGLAARLHDIGKINISGEVLDKPGPLTDEEWTHIRKHPESGYTILSSVTEYLEIANIVLFHHEKYDGTGYPNKLAGDAIPLEARIIAVADAYDAMTQQRPYGATLSHAEAIEEIKRHSGTQFDPDVVHIFLQLKKCIL